MFSRTPKVAGRSIGLASLADRAIDIGPSTSGHRHRAIDIGPKNPCYARAMKAPASNRQATNPTEPLDPIGTPGASMQTLEDLKLAAKNFDFTRTTVTLITDWQDRRENARYAFMLHQGPKTLLTGEAFGPRYGRAGQEALANLVAWLVERGATNFKESILAPSEFSRVLEEPNPANLQRLAASANPTDPNIYA
jgi:Protein of unknown function (DUF3197)